MKLVRGAWRGVLHRADSAALFWGSFSLLGDRSTSLARRMTSNFLRSFVTLYFYSLIRSAVRIARPEDPENFGNQFRPFEDLLEESGKRYLAGDEPDTLDFLLFGIIQCHCSIYVPPVTALQSDPRLERLRGWIAAARPDRVLAGRSVHDRRVSRQCPFDRLSGVSQPKISIARQPVVRR